jgi:hypothetical protein
MPDADLDHLLRRPAVVAAVRELDVTALTLEDVLAALQTFGAVRVEVEPEQYVCVLEAGGEREVARGRTVLNAAVACWAEVLEGMAAYTRRGVDELEQFLLGPDPA